VEPDSCCQELPERFLLRPLGSEVSFRPGIRFREEYGSRIMQMDREAFLVDEYYAIGAFDVLEHIEKDRRVLSPNGAMTLSRAGCCC